MDIQEQWPLKPEGAGCRKWVIGGCGCLAVAAIFLLGLSGLGLYSIYRFALPFTSTEAEVFESSSLNVTAAENLVARKEAFKKALDGDERTTITLTADELNASLMNDSQQAAGTKDIAEFIHFRINDDKLWVDFSIPLSAMPGLSGRYLNGMATLNIAIANGFLVIVAEKIEIKGKPLSEDFMRGLRSKNLAEQLMADPKVAGRMKHVTKIRIVDDRIEIEANGAEQTHE